MYSDPWPYGQAQLTNKGQGGILAYISGLVGRIFTKFETQLLEIMENGFIAISCKFLDYRSPQKMAKLETCKGH